MSHFSVMVIGGDVDGKLYPYYELECSLDNEEMKSDDRSEFVVEVLRDDILNYIQTKILYDGNSYLETYKKKLEKIDDDYDKVVGEIMNDWGGYIRDEDGDYGRYTNTRFVWLYGGFSSISRQFNSGLTGAYRFLTDVFDSVLLRIHKESARRGYISAHSVRQLSFGQRLGFT